MTELLGTVPDRLKWYFRAHIHSFNNPYGTISNFGFGFAEHNIELAPELRRKHNDLEQAISKMSNPSSLDGVLSAFKSAWISYSQLILSHSNQEYKAAIANSITRADKVLEGLDAVCRNPDYEEDTDVHTLAWVASLDLIDKYPNKFPTGQNSDGPIKIKFEPMLGIMKPHRVSAFDMFLLFDNLVANAVEATSHGTIRVLADYGNPDYSVYLIENPGIISEENIHKIREGVKFTTKPHGHGDGMLIIGDIVRKYNGRLRVSRNSGTNSTTFEIDLPYKR